MSRSRHSRRPGRLTAGLLVAVLAASGCSGLPANDTDSAPAGKSVSGPGKAGKGGKGGKETTGRPGPGPRGGSEPVVRTRWKPAEGELLPEIKLAAARAVRILGSWPAGQDGLPAARERLRAAGLPAALARRAGPLLEPLDAASVKTTVVYPQYGGLTKDTASVLVVAQQQVRSDDGSASYRTVAVDVRLRMASPWQVTGVRPATYDVAVPFVSAKPDAPLPPAAGTPTTAARAVLDNPGLDLPGTARADISSGAVSGKVLRMLDGLGRQFRLSVSVLITGHPTNVFGTDRRSNHNLGRAADIWAIDGTPVIDLWRTRPELIEKVMRAAARLGSDEVGGPVDIDGPLRLVPIGKAKQGPGKKKQDPGPAGEPQPKQTPEPQQKLRGTIYFTNSVHLDHLHFGFETAPDPPVPGSVSPSPSLTPTPAPSGEQGG